MTEGRIAVLEYCSFRKGSKELEYPVHDRLIVLSISQEDMLRFSFHMPYPIGKNIFPAAKKLPHVEHEEQDGLFRFGRPLLVQEKIIHREKDVLAHFEQALEAAKSIYSVEKMHYEEESEPSPYDEEGEEE